LLLFSPCHLFFLIPCGSPRGLCAHKSHHFFFIIIFSRKSSLVLPFPLHDLILTLRFYRLHCNWLFLHTRKVLQLFCSRPPNDRDCVNPRLFRPFDALYGYLPFFNRMKTTRIQCLARFSTLFRRAPTLIYTSAALPQYKSFFLRVTPRYFIDRFI